MSAIMNSFGTFYEPIKAEIDAAEAALVEQGAIPAYEPTRDDEFAAPVTTLPPMDYEEPPDLPPAFQQRNDLDKMMDNMEEEEQEMKSMGVLRVEDFEKVKREMGAAQLERESKLRAMVSRLLVMHGGQLYCATY